MTRPTTGGPTRIPPTVSIGLPVYNGERYIRNALDSLVTQSYSNFELIVSDNASSDNTAEICRAYARNDVRISFYANDRNIGAARNFNRVFQLSSGKYFMWAAHDDLWDPTYVAKCVGALDANSAVVLCGSDMQFIGERGEPVDHPGDYNRLDTFSLPLKQRVKSLTDRMSWYGLYGMIRAAALRKTRLYTGVFGGDVVLLMELLLEGESLILHEPLFRYRLIAKTNQSHLENITGVGSTITRRPFTELARSLLGVIAGSNCSPDLRKAMRDDLFHNICASNESFRNCILDENPALRRLSSYLMPTETRALFVPYISLAELADLRRQAYSAYVSGLPLTRRMAHRAYRFLDRNILWRFRAS